MTTPINIFDENLEEVSTMDKNIWAKFQKHNITLLVVEIKIGIGTLTGGQIIKLFDKFFKLFFPKKTKKKNRLKSFRN